MIDSNVARRYARALLALAGTERGPLEKTAEQLSRVADGIAKGDAKLLLAPGAPRAQQQGVVDALGPKLDKPIADLLGLLVERGRFDGLPQIAQAFATLVDQKLGRVRATLTSAVELSEDEAGEIEKSLSKSTGKSITLATRTDPALIGGVAAEVGGVLYDGSLRTQLERLGRELKSPPASS